MPYPSLETIQALAASGEYRAAPVSIELLADERTPIEVLRILKNVSDRCFLLESAEDAERWGRYTFLGFEPKLTVSCRDGNMTVGDRHCRTEHPATYIRELLREYKSPRIPGLPPFTGGLVGYFSFEYLRCAEPSLRREDGEPDGFQDVDLMLFDRVIAFDRLRQRIVLIANVDLADPAENYRRAETELRALAALLRTGSPAPPEPGRLNGDFQPMFSREEFCGIVERAKTHIREGDVFQLVPSNRLKAPFDGSLLGTYRVLRTLNPSPYLFYFTSPELELAGASPETLVKLEGGTLHTYPLAGTRRRGATPAEDAALERELLSDEKELAEHNMLVDLGRNDLGRVSKFGTVEIESLHTVLRFSHVMHLGSTIRGELRDDCDALDAIAAVLPAGTLSGAPKIRACQLIAELEGGRRGVYGGAVGYLDFTGNMDTCIGIRLAYRRGGTVYVRSGAGIVADSVPENEFQECLNKAAAVIAAIKEAGEAGL